MTLPTTPLITFELQTILQKEYALKWNGTHGVSHWIRVRENGLFLAETNGANIRVIELFAVLHDIKRHNEGLDPWHGSRAAKIADSWHPKYINLSGEELDLLQYACKYHTKGLTEADITIQTCWDADRLDLGRVGIRPAPHRLCTQKAKEPDIIEWAYQRSRENFHLKR